MDVKDLAGPKHTRRPADSGVNEYLGMLLFPSLLVAVADG